MVHEHCKGCIAEYIGECVADECSGKLIRFVCKPINRADTKEQRKLAYEMAAQGFSEAFGDHFVDLDNKE